MIGGDNMIKVLDKKALHPMYRLYKKTFVRPSMYLQADCISIARALSASERDIKNGRVYDGEEVLKELRKKYGF